MLGHRHLDPPKKTVCVKWEMGRKQSAGLTPSLNSRPDWKQTTPMTPLKRKKEEATPIHTPIPSPPTHKNPPCTAAHPTWPTHPFRSARPSSPHHTSQTRSRSSAAGTSPPRRTSRCRCRASPCAAGSPRCGTKGPTGSSAASRTTARGG
jgi:hypothetical protein